RPLQILLDGLPLRAGGAPLLDPPHLPDLALDQKPHLKRQLAHVGPAGGGPPLAVELAVELEDPAEADGGPLFSLREVRLEELVKLRDVFRLGPKHVAQES